MSHVVEVWSCPRCRRRYESPIPVLEVVCRCNPNVPRYYEMTKEACDETDR